MERNEVIERCKVELATNFDISAMRILSYYGAMLGVGLNAMRRIIAESGNVTGRIAAYAESKYVAACA